MSAARGADDAASSVYGDRKVRIPPSDTDTKGRHPG